jgi:hypothetical protein
MRSAVTWLVLGAVGLIGLLAVVDVVRSGPQGERALATGRTNTVPPEPMRDGDGRPPPLPERAALRAQLERAGVRGTLFFTDPECRLWALELPALTWRFRRSAPAPDCRFSISPDGTPLFGNAVWSPRADLGAVDESRSTFIEALAPETGWTHRSAGSSPSFRPDGTLTFVRDGALWQWSDRCPEGAQTVVFRTGYLAGQSTARCERVLLSKADLRRRLRPALLRQGGSLGAYFLDEAAWVDRRTLAVLVSDRLRGVVVATLSERRRHRSFARGLFASSGIIVSDLEASPRGTYLAARFFGDISVFDRRVRVRPLPVDGPRAIAWPRNERFVLLADGSGVSIVQPPERPTLVVRIPVVASRVAWAEA